MHKIANTLDKLPKRVHHKAKDTRHEIMYAPDRKSALADIKRFTQEFEAKYPKAIESDCSTVQGPNQAEQRSRFSQDGVIDGLQARM